MPVSERPAKRLALVLQRLLLGADLHLLEAGEVAESQLEDVLGPGRH